MKDMKTALLLPVDGNEPEHYTLYPLPESRKGEHAQTYFRRCITDDSGDVLVFEFDFIPNPTWEQFCGCIPHTCETCAWKDLRGAAYCPNPTDAQDVHCEEWELDSESYRRANIAYHKALHAKHYGTASVSL